MGSTYKSSQVTRPGQSVFLATPAKERIKPGYAYSLAMTVSALTQKGIPFQMAIMEDNCHVDDGRNSLVKNFLFETQCTDLVFIDADLRWDPEMFLRLISHDSDQVVAGAYPFKSYPIRFPVGKLLDGIEGETKEGLLSVSYAPTGFMRIPRTAFEILMPSQTKRGSKIPTYRFFERRYTVNTYDGGDVTFCRKWIAAGGRVLVDSKLKLEHVGEWRWAGCFLDHISKSSNMNLHTLDSKDPVPEYKPSTDSGSVVDAVSALEDGEESIEDFKIIANKWGNKPWAATAEYGEMAYKMAMNLPKGSTILECGSGFTSVILSIAARQKDLRHIILENNPMWKATLRQWFDHLELKSKIVDTNYSKERRWYDYNPGKVDLLICDGPDRSMGADRAYPITQPWCAGAAALLDDTKSVNKDFGEWIPLKLGGRCACVGRVAKITIEKPKNLNGEVNPHELLLSEHPV